MDRFERVKIGEGVLDAVTVGIERDADGAVRAAVWWPSHGDVDADEAQYDTVEEALEAARAAKALHRFSRIVVMLQSDDLWRSQWGQLSIDTSEAADHLSEAESFELARATEASRDA